MKTSGKPILDERIAKAHAPLWLTGNPYFQALIERIDRQYRTGTYTTL
jgi:hypothetical protein